MDESRFKSAREVLGILFDEQRLKRAGRYAELFDCWGHIVGERLAAHSCVADVRNGVMYVEAEHPGWIQMLQLRQSYILDGMMARFPELGLRSVVFQLGSARPRLDDAAISSSLSDSKRDEATSKKDQDEEIFRVDNPRQMNRSLDEIEDPRLRNVLTSLRQSIDKGKKMTQSPRSDDGSAASKSGFDAPKE